MTVSIVRFAIVAGCATLFGLFETLQYYVRSLMWGQAFDWPRSILANVSTSMVLAAMTPIAFFMSRRFRLERGVMAQRLLLHAVAALVFA